MKITILIVGHLRTFTQAKLSLISLLKSLKEHTINIVFSTYREKDCFRSGNGFKPVEESAYRIEGKFTDKEINDELKEIITLCNSFTLFIEENTNNWLKEKYPKYVINNQNLAIAGQLLLLFKSWSLVRDKESQDLFIRTRPDLIYNFYPSLITLCDEKKIGIPQDLPFGTLNDMFFVGKYNQMDRYCNRFLEIHNSKVTTEDCAHSITNKCLRDMNCEILKCFDVEILRPSKPNFFLFL